jgi:predicted DNA binding CopG/RHH family protein
MVNNPAERLLCTSVIEEINERKSRQNNMVVFGTEEKQSKNREEREEHDKNIVLALYKDIQLDPDNIKKVRRLRKYNREQHFRPMLVTFNSIEPKLTLFKNIHYIRKVKKNMRK